MEENWKYPNQLNTKVEDEIRNMVCDLKKVLRRQEIGDLQRKALTAAIRKEWKKHFGKNAG